MRPTGGLQLAAHLMDQFEMVEAKVGRDFDLSHYRVSLEDLEQRAQLRFGATLQEAAKLGFQRTYAVTLKGELAHRASLIFISLSGQPSLCDNALVTGATAIVVF